MTHAPLSRRAWLAAGLGLPLVAAGVLTLATPAHAADANATLPPLAADAV